MRRCSPSNRRGSHFVVSYTLVYLLASQGPLGDATLSKSDRGRQRRQPTGEKVVEKRPDAGGKQAAAGGGAGGKPHKTAQGANGKQSSGPSSDLSVAWSEVVRNHDRLDRHGDKQFPNAALGYVTPWHNRGYTLAEWEANRFELISPVWLQLVPGDKAADDSVTGCKVTGTHDVDHGWMGRVRERNPHVRIVPRLLFEKWPPMEFMRFFADQSEQDRCADVLLDYLQRNEFSGAVVELWMLVMSMSQGHVAKDLQDFVINWSEQFHARDLLFVLPVPPPLMPVGGPNDGYGETGLFTAVHLATLLPYVDYVHVMLYDFQDRGKYGPVAPLDWVSRCVDYLVRAAGPALKSKLLLGVNFYGYQYQQQQGGRAASAAGGGMPQAIVGGVYLEMLNKWKPKLMWNKNALEHYFTAGDATIYYPSLQSLALRLDLAKKYGVGVAIWDLGQGLDYFYNLL